MDQSEKPAVTAEPPDGTAKPEQGVRPPSLNRSPTSSPDPASSMETSPLRDHLVRNPPADDHTLVEDPLEEDDSDASAEKAHRRIRRPPTNERKANFPKCPELSQLPPRLNRKSKYVKENPKRENIFMYLLTNFVVVFRKIKQEDFGLTFPKPKDDEKLSLSNILETFAELKDETFKVPNFLTDQKQSIKFKQLIDKINEGGKEGFNCLDCEITKKPNLNCKVKIPSIVNGHSMVAQLKEVINNRLSGIANKLKACGNTNTLQLLNKEKAELNRVLRKLPSYEKFFIYSMENSFTNLHIDFGGTFVYYYVMEGTKVFWIAPPTKENLEVYKRLEANRQNIWTHENEFLMSNFERHELNAGDLAFIPTGYLHFVYTPCKSLVFGGNFLHLNKLKQHFEITRFEEECKVKAEKYKLFWDLQFAYIKYVFMNDVKTQFKFVGSILPKDCLETGQLFLDELEKEVREEEGGIYTSVEKVRILKELQAAMKKGTPRGKRSHPEQTQESTTYTLTDIEMMEEAQESKSKSTSVSSCSSAKRVRVM